MVHEEALLGPDAVREIVGHGPRKRIGFHPLAAFPVTALGGHFADVDFRVEVRSEGLPVIARVAVDDVEDVDLVEQVLLGIGREHVGHAGIETAAEQGHQSGVLEFLLIGPLPFVFELRHIQRFVVGGVHVVHARFKAGVHDGEILIRQGHVDHHDGLVALDQRHQLGHVVGVHTRRLDDAARAFLDARGNGVALRNRAARQHDLGENFGILRALVRHNAADAARADNKNSCHSFLLLNAFRRAGGMTPAPSARRRQRLRRSCHGMPCASGKAPPGTAMQQKIVMPPKQPSTNTPGQGAADPLHGAGGRRPRSSYRSKYV